MRNFWIFVFLILIAGCGANNESKSKEEPKPGISTAPAGADQKAEPKDHDFDSEQYIDPPKDLVARLGVDVYPGAKVLKALPAAKGGEGKTAFLDVIFFTHDPSSKVAEFYKTRLLEVKPVAEVFQNMNVHVLDGKNSRGSSIRVQAQTLKDVTSIHVILRDEQ